MKKKLNAFWRQLSVRLAEAAMPEAQLARALGVTPQTLASWKERGQFRRSLVPSLSEILRWPVTIEKIEKDMGCLLIADRAAATRVDSHPAETILRQADRAYRIAARAFSRYSETTAALLKAIGEQCFFAFSAATSSPYEFEQTEEGHQLSRAIAGAIARGALCLYIRPTEKGVSYYKDTWGFGRVVLHEDASEEIREFRRRARNLLTSGEADPRVPKISTEKANLWLHERLAQCYIDSSPMWMPGIALGMAGWYHARDLKTRVTISLPGGKFGGILVYPQYMALEYRFGRVLRAVVTQACKQVRHPEEKASEGAVQIETVDAKYRPCVVNFYTRLDQILRAVSSIETPREAFSLHPSAGSVEDDLLRADAD